MENAFIYDLATTRNPRSAFSYVNYLLAQNRLVEFANSDQLNPLREEFEDYLRWCAEQFKGQVRYGSEVVGVIPEKSGDTVHGWNVAIREPSGSTYMVRTKNIAVPSPAGGSDSKLRPLTSVNFEAGQRIISMDHYLSKRNELRAPHEPRLDIALVGSGQQTIEILDDLLSSHHVGNITVVTENESLAPLRVLSEDSSPPAPRLCSIWAKPSCESKSTITGSPELVQTIYGRAYEKQLASKGRHALRVVVGRDASGPAAQAGILLTEGTAGQGAHASSTGLFHGLDALVLGCRQKGESLEEVQFKRGAVAEGCRMWMLSAHSGGGRSLAKDMAVRAGEVVTALGEGASERDGVVLISARM
jgi:L-ornithine N5-oxygenase